MKLIYTLIICLTAACPAMAASLAGSGDRTGFGAGVVKYTTLSNNWGLLAGLRGGVIMDGKLSLGGGIYGLGGTSIKSGANSDEGNTLYHQLTYGGLEIEYLFNPEDELHYSVSGLFGLGRAGLRDTKLGNDADKNTIYVFEPGINAILNMTDHLKLGAGVQYRLVSGADSAHLNNSDLGGPSIAITVKYTGF